MEADKAENSIVTEHRGALNEFLAHNVFRFKGTPNRTVLIQWTPTEAKPESLPMTKCPAFFLQRIPF